MKAVNFTGDLNQFLTEYNYQPCLTKKLDSLGGTPIVQEILNEIVLWKVNRYVVLDKLIMEGFEQLKGLNPGEHRRVILF